MFPSRCDLACLLALCVGGACGPAARTPEQVPQGPPRIPVTFTDVTAEAGIEFMHYNGRSGRKFLPETLGSGAGFFDYDNDGNQDIFLVNSRPWSGSGAGIHVQTLPERGRRDGSRMSPGKRAWQFRCTA